MRCKEMAVPGYVFDNHTIVSCCAPFELRLFFTSFLHKGFFRLSLSSAGAFTIIRFAPPYLKNPDKELARHIGKCQMQPSHGLLNTIIDALTKKGFLAGSIYASTIVLRPRPNS